MKKKKIILRVIVVLILALLLVPIKFIYKDGGTKEYRALLYKVIIWNELNDNYENGFRTGKEFYFFPKNLHDIDYYRPAEPPALFVTKENDETLKTNTGSYCWTESKKTVCADKISPTEMKYKNILFVKSKEKLKLNLGIKNISNIKLYKDNAISKEKIEFDKEDESIIIPNLQGEYIISIGYKFDEGSTSYSFKININE